jgi:NADH dehydrogenase [ubiquinone] 1 alpha subcomplex assembly factor 6
VAAEPVLSDSARLVRRHDPDRYLTALFAPPERRESLFALYAFNFELARVREAVREPMMGRMRLQWWREAIEAIYDGRPYRHAVIRPLAAAIAAHGLDRARFERLIDTRERDVENEPPADLPALIDYANGSSAELVLLALECLGDPGRDESARRAGHAVGIAVALAGLLRAVPFHARARRLYLPQALLDRHGVKPADILELRRPAGLPAVVADVAREAERRIEEAERAARGLPRAVLPALMPGSLARLYLKRLAAADHDVFAPRVQEAPPGRVWRLWAWSLVGRF